MPTSDHPVGPNPDLDPDILEELEFWGSEADAGGTGAATPLGPVETPAGPSGAVVLVGTPIGNLGDLSPRATRALEQADVVYCEDTRHSRKLFSHAGISGVPLRSLHEHNEHERVDEILRAVADGGTVAIISDAGMPGVSDPGSRVVTAAARAGLAVTVVPGPSAVLAALVASGMPTDRFVFEGFLPRSGRERTERIAALAHEARTAVLFEAPGRVEATLGDLVEVCGGDRPVAVARELTKVHEEIWRGSLTEAAAWAATPLRGEVVLVLGGATAPLDAPVDDEVLRAALSERLSAGERTRGAVDDVASVFGVPRRRVYELALAARDSPVPPGPPPDDGAITGSPGRVGSGPVDHPT